MFPLTQPVHPTSTTVSPSMKRRQCWFMALAAPITFGPVWCATMNGLPAGLGTLNGLILLLLLATSTVTDLNNRKIYNWATYSALLLGLSINLGSESVNGFGNGGANRLGAVGALASLQGAALCFGFLLFAYTLARGGAGDVKLATAIGCLVGPDVGLLSVAFSYILAGAFIVLWSIKSLGLVRFVLAFVRSLAPKFTDSMIGSNDVEEQAFLQRPLPLAPFFAVGTLAVLLGSGV